MNNDNTLVRALHDVGLAGRFGSVLMAAVATDRATGDAHDPVDVARVTNGVWRRRRTANAGLVVANLVGATGLTVANRGLLGVQQGVGAPSAAKTVATIAAVARDIAGTLSRLSPAG